MGTTNEPSEPIKVSNTAAVIPGWASGSWTRHSTVSRLAPSVRAAEVTSWLIAAIAPEMISVMKGTFFQLDARMAPMPSGSRTILGRESPIGASNRSIIPPRSSMTSTRNAATMPGTTRGMR